MIIRKRVKAKEDWYDVRVLCYGWVNFFRIASRFYL